MKYAWLVLCCATLVWLAWITRYEVIVSTAAQEEPARVFRVDRWTGSVVVSLTPSRAKELYLTPE
ncbi:hypothetical protein [Dokdonella soli]|uniref:hypothetical protein n=1 Tax=Dokdonella soli TaxID=529810 RepID=UPI0036190759